MDSEDQACGFQMGTSTLPGNWVGCYIIFILYLKKNLDAFYLCPENLSKTKFNNGGDFFSL